MNTANKIHSPNFRIWLGSRFFSNLGKQLQDLVIAWQVYQLTKDPFSLGLIGLAYAVPFIGISLWAGHLVDRYEKRAFMAASEAGHLLATLGLFSLTFTAEPPLILVYACVSVIGLCSSFENISAIAYLQTTIPKDQFPQGAAWNLAFFQAAIIAGPLIGGWIVDHFSPRAAYGTAACLLLLSLFLAATLEPVKPKETEIHDEPAWKRVKSGLKFIRSQPLILAAMSLDMVAVLFGDCVALFPIFSDTLNGGPTGLGLLRAAPSMGSFLLSSLQTVRPFVKVSWGALKAVVTVFGICMIGFALSKTMPLAVFFLALGGMADGVSVIIRQSVYQALTPDHLRGRVASVSFIFISSSNEIGAFESGVAARLIGVVPAVVFGGAMTLGVVGVLTRVFRRLDNPVFGTIETRNNPKN